MKTIFPEKLNTDDRIAIVTLANSLSLTDKKILKKSIAILKSLGLCVQFMPHVFDNDLLGCPAILKRVEDLHEAFGNKKCKMILSATGGYNSNQLLEYINWQLIEANPKIFIGFSDLTSICNAIFTKTGLVTYYGINFNDLGSSKDTKYTIKYLRQCLFENKQYQLEPSDRWFDDSDRSDNKNYGPVVINPGKAQGTIIGGTLDTLNLLRGTQWFPELDGKVVFLEDDKFEKAQYIDRELQALLHQPNFHKVRALVFGRFQKGSGINHELLNKIVKSKKQLNNIPVIGNVDFGHTDPKAVFPIGGTVKLNAGKDRIRISIISH